MHRLSKFLLHSYRSERGNVESALVIIPVLILFLLGMQLSLLSHSRNFLKLHAQDEASTRAISGDFRASDEFIHIENSETSQNLDLLVTRQKSSLVNLLPVPFGNLSGDRNIEVSGVAIIENQR